MEDMENYGYTLFRTIPDKKAIGSQNAIYFFERKIANSLEDFLLRFNTEGHYFERG